MLNAEEAERNKAELVALKEKFNARSDKFV
mgnify:CR=1 FL=1